MIRAPLLSLMLSLGLLTTAQAKVPNEIWFKKKINHREFQAQLKCGQKKCLYKEFQSGQVTLKKSITKSKIKKLLSRKVAKLPSNVEPWWTVPPDKSVLEFKIRWGDKKLEGYVPDKRKFAKDYTKNSKAFSQIMSLFDRLIEGVR